MHTFCMCCGLSIHIVQVGFSYTGSAFKKQTDCSMGNSLCERACLTYTLGVTRALPANLILDVRYVATRGVQLHSRYDYNDPNFRFNGLLQALFRRNPEVQWIVPGEFHCIESSVRVQDDEQQLRHPHVPLDATNR